MLTKSTFTFPSFGGYSSITKDVDIVLECPHCGKVVEFTQRTSTVIPISNQYNNFEKNSAFLTLALYSKCCKSIFFANYLFKPSTQDFEFISIYPTPTASEVTSNLKELSPRFVKLYSDSVEAYNNNAFELAGSGFRNSLEILIKDFAIIKLKIDENEVTKKSLKESIDLYISDSSIKQFANGVRLLGNDHTHYVRKYQDFDSTDLLTFVKACINHIDARLALSKLVPQQN